MRKVPKERNDPSCLFIVLLALIYKNLNMNEIKFKVTNIFQCFGFV